MTARRLWALLFIFVCTALGWSVLGTSVVVRTGEKDSRLAQEVGRLWGGRHVQMAPAVWLERSLATTELVQEKDDQGRMVSRQVTRTVAEWHPLQLAASRVTVGLDLEQRRKGLLWYDTYSVSFSGRYRVINPDHVPRTVRVDLAFPSQEALYDAFVFRVDGREIPAAGDLTKGTSGTLTMPADAEATIEVAYRSRGLGDWTYAFAPAGVAQVRDFLLEMTTDFEGIDFPPGTLSPSRRSRQAGGWSLVWEFENLVTGGRIGMDLPVPINPGPFVSRVTYFAPVSLLFFLAVMVMLGLIHGTSLHPMNYFFLAAAFFSFHLLLAYLADHVDIHLAFAGAAAVSISLVVSYLRVVGGMRLALAQAGLAQLVYLVLFSYAFFFEGYTGLTVTAGAIVTLFVLMQLTAKVDWSAALARRNEA